LVVLVEAMVVVADAGTVVAAELGMVVVTATGVVTAVVVVDPAVEMDCSIVVMVVALGFGMLAPEGTKATVINWPVANLSDEGSVVVVGWLTPGATALGHTFITTWAFLPASGVSFGHRSPSVRVFSLGRVSDFEVRPSFGYSLTKRLRVALLPASDALVGSIRMTPSPSVWMPGFDAALGFVARFGCTVPHTSTASDAYQWLPIVGGVPAMGFWSS
jgi:hypothetical protein